MKLNIEKIIIVILLIVVVWFGSTIVRLENYHAAVAVGFCQEYKIPDNGEKERCLNSKATSNSWLTSLLRGLNIF